MSVYTNGHTAPVNVTTSAFDSFVEQSEREARDAAIKATLAGRAPVDAGVTAGTAAGVTAGFQEEVEERQPQPMLVIGLGGTGVSVATQLKLNFVQSAGVPERFAFLCFDSANDPVSFVDERTGKVVALEPGSEFIQLPSVPIGRIKRNRERHPELFNTYGTDAVNSITRAHIEHGAAQDRLQGALAGTFSAAMFERKVKERLHKLTERRRTVDRALEGMTTLRVFLVLSMAGGQGSGFGLIAAAIVNRILEEMSTLGERGKLTAILLLPDAFHGVENEQMQANTMAFVEELNALMLGRVTARIEYPGGHPLQVNDAPVSDVYVLGGVDEAGMALAGAEDVCALAARLVWLLNSSVVGMQEVNAMVNQANVLLNVSDGGYGTYLGTAGHATIRFPAREVIARCGARYAAVVLRELMRKTGVQPGGAQPGGLRVADPLGFHALRERLSTDGEGKPYATQLVAPKALQEMPVRDIPAKAAVMVDNHIQRRIEGDVFGQISRKAEALRARLQQQLVEQADGLVMRGKLQEALAFVIQAQAAQEEALEQLNRGQSDLAKKDEFEQQALVAAGVLMEKPAEGLLADIVPGLRRGGMERALRLYTGAASSVAQVRVERKVAEQARMLLRTIGDWLGKQRQMLETLAGRLELAQSVLDAYADELARHTGGRTEILLQDAELVDHLYQRYAGSVEVDAAMVVAQASGLQAWLAYKPNQIARAVLEAVMFRFEPILQLTVEDVLSLRWNERSMQQWLSRLESLAAAAWNPDRALLRRGGADLARYLVLGVPESARSLFAGSDTTLVTTHDRERIIALSTVYGGSFDALRPFAQWQRAYNNIAPTRSPHIFRWFQRSEDRTLHVFALGLIYGLIRSQGAWYSYHHADPLREPLRLAQGLEKSIAAFSQMHDTQVVVEERVQAEMEKEGKARTAERIGSWINGGPANGSSTDETLIKLRRAARDVLGAQEGQSR